MLTVVIVFVNECSYAQMLSMDSQVLVHHPSRHFPWLTAASGTVPGSLQFFEVARCDPSLNCICSCS